MSETIITKTKTNHNTTKYYNRRYNDHTSGKKKLRHGICGEN